MHFILDSLNLTIPKSSSPQASLRASTKAPTQPSSLRNSLNASVHSKSQNDATLRRSIEDVETKLDETVFHLATLTMDERPKAATDMDLLNYYRKLESKNLKSFLLAIL